MACYARGERCVYNVYRVQTRSWWPDNPNTPSPPNKQPTPLTPFFVLE